MDHIRTTAYYSLAFANLGSGSSPSVEDRELLHVYLRLLQPGSHATLLPKYDVTGLQTLIALHLNPEIRPCLESVNEDTKRTDLTRSVLSQPTVRAAFPDCLNCMWHSKLNEQHRPARKGDTASALYPCLNCARLQGLGQGYADGLLQDVEYSD